MHRQDRFSNYRKCELLSDDIGQCTATLDQLHRYKKALLDLTTQTHDKEKSTDKFYSFVVEIVFVESKIQKLEQHLKLNTDEYTTISNYSATTNG